MMGDGRKLVPVTARRSPDLTPEQAQERRAAQLARIGRFIERMQEARYYGKITVTLTDGDLVEVRAEQVLKINDL